MAAITFNTTHREEQVREQLETALTALREMLDAFVSNRMRQAAAEAEQARAAAQLGNPIVSDKYAMIAVQPMSPNPMRHAPTRSAAAIGRKKVTAEFRPLDGDIVNEAIPAFFIGRNMEGFWVARDVKGQVGGIFLLENSALSFARRNSQPAGCATIYPSERFELDLENKGNPLVTQLGWLKRFAMRGRQRWGAFIGIWRKR